MKRLGAVLLLLSIIPALLLLPAMIASAKDLHWHWGGIHGTYAMTGTGNCLWTPGLYNGQTNDFIPIPPPLEHPEYMTDLMTGYRADPTYSTHVSAQGLWEFRLDGTGTAEFTHFGISAPPIVGPVPPTFGVSGSMKYHFDFRYHFDQDGLITIEMVPDPNMFQGYMTSGPKAGIQFTVDRFTFSGIISADHKTLTLTTKNEKQLYANYPKTATAPSPSQKIEECTSVCNSGRILTRVSR